MTGAAYLGARLHITGEVVRYLARLGSSSRGWARQPITGTGGSHDAAYRLAAFLPTWQVDPAHDIRWHCMQSLRPAKSFSGYGGSDTCRLAGKPFFAFGCFCTLVASRLRAGFTLLGGASTNDQSSLEMMIGTFGTPMLGLAC